jgi:hypothetical protein
VPGNLLYDLLAKALAYDLLAKALAYDVVAVFGFSEVVSSSDDVLQKGSVGHDEEAETLRGSVPASSASLDLCFLRENGKHPLIL